VFFSHNNFPATVRDGSGGSWPAGAAAPQRRNPNSNFFTFFCLFSPLLNSQNKLTKNISQRPRSIKRKLLPFYLNLIPCGFPWFGSWCVDVCCAFWLSLVLDMLLVHLCVVRLKKGLLKFAENLLGLGWEVSFCSWTWGWDGKNVLVAFGTDEPLGDGMKNK
jgi:hypothetical protein